MESPGFFSSIAPAFTVGTTGQIVRSLTLPRKFITDPSFPGIAGLDADTRNELLDGISLEFRSAFVDARSLEDARIIRQRTLIVQDAELRLAQAGFSGIAARFVTTALDPVEAGAVAATAWIVMCRPRSKAYRSNARDPKRG